MMYGPLYRHRPPFRWTYGDLAARVGSDLGLPPDDEQRWLLDTMFSEREADIPAAFEVAVVSPRQNIKTSTLGIAALTDLFVLNVERHLWTAHHGDTLKGTFQDFRSWIKRNPEYDEQVTFYEGHQDMSIVHKETGATIDFQSRSGKATRGLTGVMRVTLDEALYLEPKHVGAVYPTMLTRPGAQVRVASSAGMLGSVQLRRIRDRGRAGKDRKLAYVEYGAKVTSCASASCQHSPQAPGCAYDDRELWWQANCALWAGRISEESLANMRSSMPPAEWAREFYSWWEDPESTGGALPYETWRNLADVKAERGERVAFGLDVTEARDAWVAVAWERSDGSTHVMLANDGMALPVSAAPDECARLARRWGGQVIAAKAFKADLDEVGADAQVMTSEQFAAGSGAFADAVAAGSVRHGNQDALNGAVKAAMWRSAGTDGTRAFKLSGCPEVGPLAAAVRALHGLNGPSAFNIW